jgi:hypothetical protein
VPGGESNPTYDHPGGLLLFRTLAERVGGFLKRLPRVFVFLVAAQLV